MLFLTSDTSWWDQDCLEASNGQVKIGVCKFLTIPVSPQLQARYCNANSARDMKYLACQTEEILAMLHSTGKIPVIEDIAMGHNYLSAYLAGDIKPLDIVLLFSINGAQLYKKKQSNCWIYIWIIINLSPDKQYRKVNVLPGGFIPGPNKLHNVESFLFPGFHHLLAIQKEGLTIWNASENNVFRSHLYLIFVNIP